MNVEDVLTQSYLRTNERLSSWLPLLSGEFCKPYIFHLRSFLRSVTSDPESLTEGNLDGATLTVTLRSGFTFADGVSASSFELVTSITIAGLSIGNVAGGASGTGTATLTLATGASYGFNTPATLAVRVLAAAHSDSADVTSTTLPLHPFAEQAE